MSLILDALRKMEQERKSRLGGTLDIRPEVLRYRNSSPPEKGKPYLLVSVALVLVAAGIGAGLLLKDGGKKEPVNLQAAQQLAAPSEPASTSLPPSLPAQPPAAAAAPPVPPQVMVPPSAPAASSAPALPREVPAPAAATPSANPLVRPPAGGGRSRRTQPAQPQESSAADAAAPADIAVSGIAWQEERSLRRAVVNGALVGEGTEVGGGRVVEIRESRVRFSRGGRTFEVEYSSDQSGH